MPRQWCIYIHTDVARSSGQNIIKFRFLESISGFECSSRPEINHCSKILIGILLTFILMNHTGINIRNHFNIRVDD